MLLLGLTGSIGMGKSLTLRAMRVLRRGLAFYDADAAVHSLYQQPHIINTIKQAFPAVYRHGTIDRKALSDAVFSDPAAERRLREILYPHLTRLERRAVMAAARRKTRLMVLDIPLLFETGAARRVDRILVVSAPYFIQKARVLARAKMSQGRFEQINNAQMDDKSKRKRADYVVPTGLGRAHTTRCLQKLLRTTTVGYAVRTRWRTLVYMKEFYARNRS